ncbi:MAG: cation transporter [Acetatifactor sp.]|nr:cation transporter [Acetatifactor sp.]
MITLLSRLFIKNHSDIKNPSVRRAYGMLCGALGIGLNLILSLGKFVAGVLSGSISITADAFNNLLDAASSVITLMGFRMAGQKPDSDHPFGHGRIEYVSGFLVSVLTLLTMIELIKSSFEKILHPQIPAMSPLVLSLLAFSILVKCYMYLYNRKLGKRLESPSMGATAVDSLSDALATTVVLTGALISRFAGLSVDGWCGLAVCFFIGYAGYEAARDAVSPLLGQAPDREFVKQVHDLVLSHEGILGVHDLIVHNYGPGNILISLHAEVPADGSLITLHELIDTIEHQLHDELQCQAVIHMDPVLVGDEETDRLCRLTKKCLAEIDTSLTIHDFRIASCPEGTRLLFDVAAPYDFPMSDADLADIIDRKIRDRNPALRTVIEVDKQQF